MTVTLLMVPAFISLGLVHATRQRMQSSADAAALAAAAAYASRLNRDYSFADHGLCPSQEDVDASGGEPVQTPLEDVVLKYSQEIWSPVVDGQQENARAYEYAAANGSEMVEGGVSLESGSRPTLVAGLVFPSILIRVTDVRRSSPVMLSSLYGTDAQPVYASAAAEFYLSQWSSTSIECAEYSYQQCERDPALEEDVCDPPEPKMVSVTTWDVEFRWRSRLVAE